MKTNVASASRSSRTLARLVAGAAATTAAVAAVAASTSHAACTQTTCQNAGSQNGQADTHGPGGTNRNADPQAGILPPGAQAKPVLDKRVALGSVSGIVRVKLPGATSFVALGQGGSVPVGSTVDATAGALTLSSVKDADGTVQQGRFWGAQFRVTQTPGSHPATVLTLADNLGACAARSAGAVMSASRRRTSRLWGRDHHGRFVTRGHYGVASVRGTVWLTQDTCSGTFVKVTRGTVVVHDLRRHRKVSVSAGHGYLARR